MHTPRTSIQVLLIVFALIICGCKKIITVNLKSSNKLTVITGIVTNQEGPYTVSITKTADFYADNDFETVSGASVIITGNGTRDSLTETSPGIYRTHSLKGVPGHTYSLHVVAEGNVYTATSTMPKPVYMDSIDFREGAGGQLYAVVSFQDPIGVPNYYEFIEYIDEKRLDGGRGHSLFDDRLSDGRYISRLLYDDSSYIRSGVRLSIEMNCVDEPVYQYLSQLLQITGGNGGFGNPAPDNPVSNISGGALGYFSAQTVSKGSIKIP